MGSFPVQPTPRLQLRLPSQSNPRNFLSRRSRLGSEVIIPEPQFDETPPEILPEESIWIQSPENGANSSGILTVQGISDPTFEQNLVIRLVDQNNIELLRTNTIIQADAGSRGDFSTAIDIPLTSTTQPAILQVFSVSPKMAACPLIYDQSLLNSEMGKVPNYRNERILINSVKTNGTGTDAVDRSNW